MPRCQWCRQDSQNPDVCDWCKRPLAAGWTPAAAAMPADRMSFASSKADEPGSDRLLMFSMIGIVVVVALALGMSLLGRKQKLPSVQPAAPPIVQPQAPPLQTTVTPTAPVVVSNSPVYQAPPPAPDPEPAYAAAPPPINDPEVRHVGHSGNRKLDSILGVTQSN